MKYLSFITLLLLISANLIAQPLLVGHRGSTFGVENTEEAYRSGAARGYQYVETDIKVTKDGYFVLTHDDNLSRLSDSDLTIAGSTLAELQAVTLTQTRSGVTYTGKLLELGAFLDLCTELNVLPVIELKWATGVNSNDQSNMPALVKVIQDKGYYNKAIVLTSMKPCLEWLRTNHPDIAIQLLVSTAGSNHIDWCKKWKADIDIEYDVCFEADVDLFHEAGLKVNMWTTNTETGYKTYATMGCDFITTDDLDGNNLPAYDPKVYIATITGDYVDPLAESGIMPASDYAFRQESEHTFAELAGKTIRRIVEHNSLLYVLALDGGNAPTILVINPLTKEVIPVSTFGLVPSAKVAKADEARLLACSDIQVTQDGYLLASQVAETTADAGDLVIYYWALDAVGLPTGNPQPWIHTQANGNYANAYVGETFVYSGTKEKGNLFLSTEAINSTGNVRISVIPIENGTTTNRTFATTLPPARGFMTRKKLGEDFRFTLSPLDSKHIMVSGSGAGCILADFAFMKNDNTSAIELSSALNTTDMTHFASVLYAGAAYAVVPTIAGAQLLDITQGIENATSVTTTGLVAPQVAQPYVAAAKVMKVDDKGEVDVCLFQQEQMIVLTTRAQTDGLTDVEWDEHAPITYYTILGAEVNGPLTPGVYIKKQGSKAEKVFIR